MFGAEKPDKPKRVFAFKEAKIKAADYCAYQERTQQQVRNKLYDYGLRQAEVEEVLSDLITRDFVNEERFAMGYAGGKFRMKKWGRLKIIQGLKQLKLSDYCVKKGLEEIEESAYMSTLRALMEKKKATISESNSFLLNKKLANYLIQKGYEPDLVWEVLREDSQSIT